MMTSQLGERRHHTTVNDYFTKTTKLVHTLCLVDFRHEPSALDKQMVSYLYTQQQPFTVVATKADKLSRSQQHVMKQKLAATLLLGADNIIVTSASDGQGRQQLLDRIDEILSNKLDPSPV